jgi:hypothetical protein
MRLPWRSLSVLVLVSAIGTTAFAEPPGSTASEEGRGVTSTDAPSQTPGTRRAPAAPSRGRLVETSLFGHIGSLSFAARESFDAVLGSASGRVVGGGGEVRFVRGRLNGVFVRVDASRFRERGERAFVFDGQVFGLGIPMTVTVTPVEFSGGYRYVHRRSGGRSFPIVPYGGIGVGTVQYREESSFAEPGENVNDWFTSYHAFGGVEVRIWRWIGVGVEGHYRSVPDGLGQGGISEEFNETNLGGATVRVLLGVTF